MRDAYASYMLRPLTHMLIRLSLLLGITLGLVGAGFAHQTTAPIDPELAAFVEAGGALSDLCGDGGPVSHWGVTGCEACRLTDTAMGADAFDHRPLSMVLRATCDGPRQKVLLGEALPNPYGARAPPVV